MQPHLRNKSRWQSETGSVTAELAIAMPAVSLIIAITLGAFALQVDRMKLVDVAATAARAFARGEPEENIRQLTQLMLANQADFVLDFAIQETLACVTLSKEIAVTGLGANLFQIKETSCARKMGL
jgi:hypothetical protein